MNKDNSTHFSKLVTVTDGHHNVKFYCNDTKGNINETNLIYFTVDTTPPQWDSQFENSTVIAVGGSVLLSVHWTDNIQLDTAILSTNESGVWENKTVYGSPKSLSGISDWSNFTWSNLSISSGTTVAWRVYTNDTSGHWNSTNTMTFKVENNCIVSLSTNAIDFGSVAPGTDTGNTNQQVTVTNSGNTPATNVTIKGNDWSDGGTNTMPVGQTEWSTSAFTYGSGTALTTSDAVVTTNLANGNSITIYFGVGVPSGQAAGTYNQTITITMNC